MNAKFEREFYVKMGPAHKLGFENGEHQTGTDEAASIRFVLETFAPLLEAGLLES